MEKKYKQLHKYEAQGFVEALIAILITGIASVALMTIASETIGEVVKNEKRDQLTQEAVKGNNILEYVIEEWNFGRRDLLSATSLPLLQNDVTFVPAIGSCYALDAGTDGDIESPVVTYLPGCEYFYDDDHDGENTGIWPSQCLNPTAWGEVKVDDYDPDGTTEGMFRILCVANVDSSEGYVLVAKIYTGFQSCESLDYAVGEFESADSSCSMYEYTSIYTVEP